MAPILLTEMAGETPSQLRSSGARHRNNHNIIFHHTDIISRLPFDISSMIFRLAQSMIPCSRAMRFAHRIASVCRTWRAIALQYPLLWNRVEFRQDSRLPRGTIALWLQRTVDCPIHLRLVDSFASSYRHGHRVSEIMSLLHRQIHRWRSLEVELWGDLFEVWAPCLVGTAHTMYSLYLKLNGIHMLNWMTGLACPNLRTLSIDSRVVHVIATDPQLRRLWNIDNLQSLTVRYEGLRDASKEMFSALRDVLEVARGVASLDLRGLQVKPIRQGSIPPRLPSRYYAWPNLVKIRLEKTNLRLFREFLASSSLLSLAEVRLIDIFPDRSDVDFKSNLRLESLYLKGDIRVPKDQFLPYLLDCNHLVVNMSPNFDDGVVYSMSRPNHRSPIGRWICPRLESIELHGCRNISDIYLRRLVDSRIIASNGPRPAVTAIKRLIVSCNNVISDENKNWFTQHLDFFQWKPFVPNFR